MTEGGRQRRASYRLLIATLWTTLLVLAVEVVSGWASYSLSLLAASLHTLIDSFSTVLSLVAVSSPQRTLGREIWGHGRAEVVGTLILIASLGFGGVSLLLLAVQQMEASVQGEVGPFPVDIELQVIQLILAMVIITLTVALFSGYQARRLLSLALQLNTRHILQDAWLSFALLGGLWGIRRGYHWLDPILAIALVILAVRSLVRVLNAQLPMLLKPTAIAPEAIAEIACQVEGVTRCTRILSRGMVGRQVWIELHLALHPDFMDQARQIGEKVEGAIRERYGPIRARIWVEETHSPYLQSPDSPASENPQKRRQETDLN